MTTYSYEGTVTPDLGLQRIDLWGLVGPRAVTRCVIWGSGVGGLTRSSPGGLGRMGSTVARGASIVVRGVRVRCEGRNSPAVLSVLVPEPTRP